MPQRAAAHLRPLRLGLAAEGTSSPFIFSPLQPHRRSGRSAKLDLLWVEGEVCAVALQLCNPMPFELRVSHMVGDPFPWQHFQRVADPKLSLQEACGSFLTEQN